MKVRFDIEPDDGQRVQSFYEKWASHPLVSERHRRNVRRDREPVTEAAFWDALVTALLTTQQRAGPSSPVARFVNRDPFPLPLRKCRTQPCANVVSDALKAHGGIRRGPTIAGQAEKCLRWLDSGGWERVHDHVRELERLRGNGPARLAVERSAARDLAEHLAGIGPKQSRNVLQMLGLTQYEVPLDSRVAKWLTKFGFPLEVRAVSLGDRGYYELVEDGFQALCAQAGVLPCLMDAAVFASFDPPGSWERAKFTW